MRVVLLLLSLVSIGAVAQASTSDPGGTPPFVATSVDPRLFSGWNGQNEEVWALYHSGSGTFTQYYYEVPTGALKQLRYDVTITASAGGNLTLALTQGHHQCGVYQAHFMDATQQILIVKGDNAPEWNGPRSQGFSVMRAAELPLDLKILNSSAAQQAAVYRQMQQQHIKFDPPVPLPSPVDPRFSPAC
jgi:hypothetical protein